MAGDVDLQVTGLHDEFVKASSRDLRSEHRMHEHPGQAFSGISTRSGDVLSVLVKSMGVDAAEQAQKLHISLVAEVILELKESGTVLLE